MELCFKWEPIRETLRKSAYCLKWVPVRAQSKSVICFKWVHWTIAMRAQIISLLHFSSSQKNKKYQPVTSCDFMCQMIHLKSVVGFKSTTVKRTRHIIRNSNPSTTANKEIHCLKWGGGLQTHHIILRKNEVVNPTAVTKNYSSWGEYYRKHTKNKQFATIKYPLESRPWNNIVFCK